MPGFGREHPSPIHPQVAAIVEASGVDRRTVYAWIRGDREPIRANLRAIEAAMKQLGYTRGRLAKADAKGAL